MSSKARKMVKGSVLRIIEFAANAIIGLAMMPFIIHSLGDKMYGLWIFVGSFLGYYGLMDFGLNTAVQRFISRSIGSEDSLEMNKVANTSLVIFACIGLVVLVMSFAIAFLFPLFIKNIADQQVFKVVVLILGLNCAIGFPLRVFSGIISADLRYDIRAIIEIAKLFLRTCLILFFLKNGFGVIAVAWITLGVDISGYISMFFVVRILYPYIVIAKKYIDLSKIKTLFGYSVYSFITQLADQARFNIDNLVIVFFIGLSSVTFYSIGARLMRYFWDFMGCAFGMTMPIFSQYEGSNNYDLIREKYMFLTKISSYASLVIGGMLIVFGKAFIIRWVGKDYANSYYIFIILLIPFIFDVLQMPGNGLLYGLSKHKYYAISNTIEGLANLILSVILVRKYGIYGVALGTAVPMFVMKIFIQPLYICKIIGLSYKKFYIELMQPIVLLSLGGMFIYWLIIRRFITPNYLNLFALALLGLALFLFVIYKHGFSKPEQIYLKKILLFERA